MTNITYSIIPWTLTFLHILNLAINNADVDIEQKYVFHIWVYLNYYPFSSIKKLGGYKFAYNTKN